MSRILKELLGVNDPGFSLMIGKLESIAGRPSIDVRLTAELLAGSKQRIAALQLDKDDTNGPELYHSLLLNVAKHDELLQKTIVGDTDDMLKAIKSAVHNLSISRSCWALKQSSLRRILTTVPPRNVMKHQGYRSIDSMLKREQLFELVAAAFIIESPTWRSRYMAKYKTLRPSDFENRQAAIVVLDPAKWGQALLDYVHARQTNLICLKEIGVVAVLPLPTRHKKGLTFTLLPLLIRAFHDIRSFSVYAKLHQVRADFGALLKDYLLTGGLIYTGTGHSIAWPVLQRHFSQRYTDRHRTLLNPHVGHDDLDRHTYTEAVTSLSSALQLWEGSEYMGAAYPDGVVSYNLLDASLNYCNNVPYHKRLVYYMREALYNELMLRYLRQEAVEERVLLELENSLAGESEPVHKERKV